jgi:hypothetical protein
VEVRTSPHASQKANRSRNQRQGRARFTGMFASKDPPAMGLVLGSGAQPTGRDEGHSRPGDASESPLAPTDDFVRRVRRNGGCFENRFATDRARSVRTLRNGPRVFLSLREGKQSRQKCGATRSEEIVSRVIHLSNSLVPKCRRVWCATHLPQRWLNPSAVQAKQAEIAFVRTLEESYYDDSVRDQSAPERRLDAHGFRHATPAVVV